MKFDYIPIIHENWSNPNETSGKRITLGIVVPRSGTYLIVDSEVPESYLQSLAGMVQALYHGITVSRYHGHVNTWY